MKRLLFPAMAAVFLAGCSNMTSVSPTQPSTIKLSIGGAVREGVSAAKSQQITVDPAEIVFCGGGTATVTATTNFSGSIIASSTPGCLLTPGITDTTVDPGNGHSATFTVGSNGASCTLTFIDRKGNTATATGSQSGDGGCGL